MGKPSLPDLRKHCRNKPYARQETSDDRSCEMNILGGFLDGFAEFEEPGDPEINLRLRKQTVDKLGRASKPVEIDRAMSKNWKTAEKGWYWVTVTADESFSQAELIRLLDESYDLAMEFLDDKTRARLERIKKKKGAAPAMTLDLSTDFEEITGLLTAAVEKYALKSQAKSSARRHPPVTRVDMQFSLGDSESAPWVHVHFDTKPGCEPDGDPTHPDFARLKRKHWLPAVKAVAEEDKVTVVMPSGKKLTCDWDRLTDCVGKLLVEVQLSAKKAGLFEPLPRADRCELGVEDPETGWGWPTYAQRGKKNRI